MKLSEEEINEYRVLRDSDQVLFVHCSECFGQKPKDISPQNWAQLELLVDRKTGNTYAGCRRCELPIIIGVSK